MLEFSERQGDQTVDREDLGLPAIGQGGSQLRVDNQDDEGVCSGLVSGRLIVTKLEGRTLARPLQQTSDPIDHEHHLSLLLVLD